MSAIIIFDPLSSNEYIIMIYYKQIYLLTNESYVYQFLSLQRLLENCNHLQTKDKKKLFSFYWNEGFLISKGVL